MWLSLNDDNSIGSWSKQALPTGPVAVATRIVVVDGSVTVIVNLVGAGLALSFLAAADFATLAFGLVFSATVLIDATLVLAGMSFMPQAVFHVTDMTGFHGSVGDDPLRHRLSARIRLLRHNGMVEAVLILLEEFLRQDIPANI